MSDGYEKMPDEEQSIPPYTWWQRNLCGLEKQELAENVRNVAIVEFSLQVVSLAWLLFTAVEEGGIHERADWWSLVDLVLQMPTLAVLLFYIMKLHPNGIFLRWFYVWLWLVAVLYGAGISVGIWELATSDKHATGRFFQLVLDLLSLGLLANLLYVSRSGARTLD